MDLDQKKNSSGKPKDYYVAVLRLGHRLVRDERISTHIGLVSRAFGAKELIISGSWDDTSEAIEKASRSWGGTFKVSYLKNWKESPKNWKGVIVHLTMYGEIIDDALPKIRKDLDSKKNEEERKILLVVGAEKVPAEIYSTATYNVAIGSQPHSEVAALAVFLDRLFMGEELHYSFSNAKIRIVPSLRGKKLVEISKDRI